MFGGEVHQDGSVGKVLALKLEYLTSISRTNMIDGKNRVLKVVL